jgi:hypothetical protein
MAALKVLAFSLALLNPAAVNLLVLPPTVCWASPKNYSNVSVLIACGLILLPFDTQYICITVTCASSSNWIQNQVSLAK